MAYYIGIDLGGTNISAGLVSETGEVVLRKSVPTNKGRENQALVQDMARMARALADESGFTDIVSIGIGAPGTTNNKLGTIVYANNINFRNVPTAGPIREVIDLPVYLDNDANCAALAESMLGAAREADDSLTITIGTGLGCGIIIGGKIYSGFNSDGGEAGHMCIIVDGELCSCGRRGCWEAYASATALINQAIVAARWNSHSLLYKMVEGDLNRMNARIPFDAADEGDDIARIVVDKYIRYLAEGMANLINLFQPEILVLGGGVSRQGESLYIPMEQIVRRSVHSKEELPQTRFVPAKLGGDAGIIGAAMLGVMHRA